VGTGNDLSSCLVDKKDISLLFFQVNCIVTVHIRIFINIYLPLISSLPSNCQAVWYHMAYWCQQLYIFLDPVLKLFVLLF